MTLEEGRKHLENIFCSSWSVFVMSLNINVIKLQFLVAYSVLSFPSLSCVFFSHLFHPFSALLSSFLSQLSLYLHILGSSKCHTTSFTLTSSQFRNQTTQRWLVRGHPSYLGLVSPSVFPHSLSFFHVTCFFIFITWHVFLPLYWLITRYCQFSI